MEYEYENARYKESWKALKDFENKKELYLENMLSNYDRDDNDDDFLIANANDCLFRFRHILIRKEKKQTKFEIETEVMYTKEFVNNTAWIVSDYELNDNNAGALAYACTFLKERSIKRGKFMVYASYNQKLKSPKQNNSSDIVEYRFARHLTEKEKRKHLGVK